MATLEQQRFFSLLRKYPRIIEFWDLDNRKLDIKALESDMSLSSGENALARFFAAIWLGKNEFNFDIAIDISSMDQKARGLVAEWVKAPFFP